MRNQDIKQLYETFVLPTYRQLPVCLAKGKGGRVWDLEGKEYLDFFPGWGVSGLGHSHPAVVSAIKDQARKLIHVSNNFLNPKQARLAEAISEASFPARVFFGNSGAEANEGAIKFARRYGSATGRYEIITMENSFHGRTLATITATGQTKYQEGFAPLPEGFGYVPFNDLEALKKRIGPKTVAVMLELIQGEGGINVASPEYVREIRRICDEKDLLLIADEVQTGMGRTGKFFAYQHYGIEPDLMTLAKALGGGVPIGALVVNRRIKGEILTPGTHASTFGGNPLACAAALGVFKAIRKEKLLRNTEIMGAYLREKLEELKTKYSFIREIRGMGLMLGMDLSIPGAKIAEECLNAGLLINCTHETVLRIMPAMIVSKTFLNRGLFILDKVLANVRK
ncbi:MAG TPA: aspartate aminotransferase family protein [Candidatus Omnitrophota bacterium]|nr:aspartate aminotransferase family protein [Candidatus Omnitrophota bacterium]